MPSDVRTDDDSGKGRSKQKDRRAQSLVFETLIIMEIEKYWKFEQKSYYKFHETKDTVAPWLLLDLA